MEERADLAAPDRRLAMRLEQARHQRGLTLEVLAARSGVSRATLSRIERAQTSPTAAVLGRLCPVFGTTLSQLLQGAEAEPPSLVTAAAASVWTDPETGFRRTLVSPPRAGFGVEVMRGELPGGATIAYPNPPIMNLEHHVLMVAGTLDLEVEGTVNRLHPGDCLRYRLAGASRYANPGDAPAIYFVVIRRPS